MRPSLWPEVDGADAPVVTLPGTPESAPYLDSYRTLRSREQWNDPDEIVAEFPRVPADHPHAAIWHVRALTLRRLVFALEEKGPGLRILDFACGTGWMSHVLAKLPRAQVYGLDLDAEALAQAARVFGHHESLRFVRGDVFASPLPERRFDVVVVAAAVAYFADLPALVRRLMSTLALGGELHIIESPFYEGGAGEAAAERSRAHFAALGIDAMSAYHHHHALAALKPFNPELRYRPGRRARLRARLAGEPFVPFAWVVLRRR